MSYDPQSDYSDTGGHNGGADSGETASRAFHDSKRYLSELSGYAGHYVSAKIDQLKLSVRNLILLIVVGVLGGLVAVAMLATAIVLLMAGIAQGLGHLMGGMIWLGNLIVGLVVLGAFAGVAMYVLARLKVVARLKTVRKYEAAREHQRRSFGRDVAEQAAAAGRVAN